MMSHEDRGQKNPSAHPQRRVVVAMSGGADSSVAAALLVKEGYDVIGIMLRLWAADVPADEACTSVPAPATHFVHNRCCTPDAVEDARSVCAQLDIPFYLVNAERPFRTAVVDPFVSAYAAGLTPNPCLACNRYIRFGFLLRYAKSLGAQYLATGHYARVRRVNGMYRLLKGTDYNKDQSYVLYMLEQEDLAAVLFPVGEYDKPTIREMAREFGLPVADKEDSQDLCFVAEGNYRQLLAEEVPEALKPGPILDVEGRLLGTHRGLPLYTIGQRRGLGITTSKPLYVLKLQQRDNTLIVGPSAALETRDVEVESVHYVAGRPPAHPISVTAKVRYKSSEMPAMLVPLGVDKARLQFESPQRAVAPGQAAVFYDGDILLGGGTIRRGA